MTVGLAPDAITAPTAASGVRAAKLAAIGLSKYYGPVAALEPSDISIAEGELLTVLGPSGSGKTTLLQVMCGLVEPTAGRLLIDGRDETHTPVHRRRMGVVFQNYALFPHFTVTENVSFPLDVARKHRGPELARRVTSALEIVGLGELRTRFPRELSGGQQQRVALARCLVYEPAVILMDEPLGALDRKLRETMQIEIKRLHRQTGATIVFVTHDQDEALALSDRICLMNEARIEQIGTPRDIYERPRTLFAAGFIGISNVLRGRADMAGTTLLTADGPVTLPTPATPGEPLAIVVRPEHMTLGGPLCGEVTETVYAGAETRVLVTLPSGTVLTIRRSPALPPVFLGDRVGLGWRDEFARVLAL